MYKTRSLKYKKTTQLYCVNCGKTNHNYVNCMETLNSYGILCFYKDNLEINDKSISSTKLIMVRRQHTIPYVEFLRGKYHTLDLEYLIILFSRMVREEIELIVSNPQFEKLREDLKLNNKQRKKYKDEYLMSENKFNVLLSLGNLHYIIYVINYLFNENFNKKFKSSNINLLSYKQYIETNKEWIEKIRGKLSSKNIYNYPEWGVPKGRRQNKESDLKCALREFSEETGIMSSNIKIYKNVIPLEEIYIGLNGIEYKHTYFLAECITLPDNYKYYLGIDEYCKRGVKQTQIHNMDKQEQIDTIDNAELNTHNTKNLFNPLTNIHRNIMIPIKDNNKEQLLEISKVTIMTLQQIKEVIRPYHTQKMNIINKAFYIILQKNLFFE